MSNRPHTLWSLALATLLLGSPLSACDENGCTDGYDIAASPGLSDPNGYIEIAEIPWFNTLERAQDIAFREGRWVVWMRLLGDLEGLT